MEHRSPKYVLPAPDIAWAPRVEAGAGVYLLAGRWHFAAAESPAERALLDAGALRIGTLRFDADPTERMHRGHFVRTIGAREAATHFGGGLEGN